MLGDSLRRRRPTGRKLPPIVEADGDAEDPGRDRARRGIRTTGGPGRAGGPLAGLGWLGWLGAGVVVLLVSFLVGYIMATQVLFPRPETAGTGIPVPNLYGLEMGEAARALGSVGLDVGPVSELASQRAPAGRVLAQDPVPEQQLRPGATVALAVSAGPPEARVPPLTGLGATTARGLLEAAGFEVDVQHVRTRAVPPNAVVRTDPEAGSRARLPAVVTLVLSAGPEEPDPAEATDPADPPDAPAASPWP